MSSPCRRHNRRVHNFTGEGVFGKDRLQPRVAGKQRTFPDVDACVGPSLLDESGNPYDVQTNDYLNDKYFYDTYVMTDVTLKDSVLETSGLFSVGIETNFAGTVLYAQQDSIIFEGWPGTGGTSFPSVLRLEGDVRMYDWKDLSLVDSSTLIDSEQSRFKLNISAMLDYVCTNYSGTQYGYEYIIDRKQNVNYVLAV